MTHRVWLKQLGTFLLLKCKRQSAEQVLWEADAKTELGVTQVSQETLVKEKKQEQNGTGKVASSDET